MPESVNGPTDQNEDRLVRAVEEVRDELRQYREWATKQSDRSWEEYEKNKSRSDYQSKLYLIAVILLSLVAFLFGSISNPFNL